MTGPRFFTPRECARLQGFPESFLIDGPNENRWYYQCGNSVCPGVVAKIAQACSLFSAPEGRVYRPRDSERLVLYLKDLNLPKPDMYNTCMLIASRSQARPMMSPVCHVHGYVFSSKKP